MPEATISPNQCRFCAARKCYTRICTRDLRFDEVACNAHVRELEQLSDGALGVNNGVMRMHYSSSAPQSRGEDVNEVFDVLEGEE